MMKRRGNRQGFTLAEVIVSSAILVIAVTMATAGLGYFVRSMRLADAQTELDMQVQVAMESIKYNTRLSSLDEFYFSPAGTGPYIAMGFPMARDDDGDGVVDLDEMGNVIWDRTLIYHVWSSEPHQLRLTVFDPRDNSLTESERQAQIDAVTLAGHGQNTYNGAHASTHVVFENLFTWDVKPRGSTFDGYSSNLTREVHENLGTCILGPGSHTFEFSAIGKNDASSGYKVGIDSLFMSPSYSYREAEAQLPVSSQVGAAADAMYMQGGSWDGNYQVYFPATAVGHAFTLTMDSDRWEETNFNDEGDSHDDTKVEFRNEFIPKDFVVMLNGLGTNWSATSQSGDLTGASLPYDAVKGYALRVILRGEDMPSGGWFQSNGGRCRVNFRSGSGSLYIRCAFIGECASMETNSPDIAAGTLQQLTFGGAAGIGMSAGATAWSDYVNLEVDQAKSYIVSFLVGYWGGTGNAWGWSEINAPTDADTYGIPWSSAPGLTEVMDPVWSTRGDVVSTNVIVGVQHLFTTYPPHGYYTSRIFDTQSDAPDYSSIEWTEEIPSDSRMIVRLRTADNPDMSDAVSWSNAPAMVPPASVNPGDRRYVQFRAELEPSSSGFETPMLRDLTVTWPGEERAVDVGGTFTTGPDYGLFSLKVNGQPLRTGVSAQLEIFKDVYGFGAMQRVTSAMATEIRPRNTGR